MIRDFFNAFGLLDARLCTAAAAPFQLRPCRGRWDQQPLGLIHSRSARRSKTHVFLPKCQGQSVPCQTNMENKPEELQLCVKTRGSFEATLAHQPWPHLSLSCYGELDAWTHTNTAASNPIFRRSKTQIKDSNQRQGALTQTNIIQLSYAIQLSHASPQKFHTHGSQPAKTQLVGNGYSFDCLGLTESNKDCSNVSCSIECLLAQVLAYLKRHQ